MLSLTGLQEYAIARDNYAINLASDRKGFCNVYVGGNSEDIVTNYTGGTEIYTQSGNDSVNNIASSVIIDTQDGDDSVIAVGAGIDLDVGDGADKVLSQGVENTVNTGEGQDTVYTSGYGGTIVSTKDDTVVKSAAFELDFIKNQGIILNRWYDINNYLTAEVTE